VLFILSQASFNTHFILWERLIFIGGTIFFLNILFKSILTLKLGRDTIKNLSIEKNRIEFKIFSGKINFVNRFSVIKSSAGKFGKHYLHFFLLKKAKC